MKYQKCQHIYCLYIYIHIYILVNEKVRRQLISLKKNCKMNFSKNSHFLKSVSRFKARYKRTMRFTQIIVQVGMTLSKKKSLFFLLRLILNILPFLIVVVSLFYKYRSLLNSSKILYKL